MFLFNMESVYIGYSLQELSKVRDILKREGIKYSYKVVNNSGQWSRLGTRRSRFGSFGMNMNYEKQYAVYVHKKDLEKAKNLVNSVLHQ